MLLWNDALTAEAERTLAAMRTALEAEDGERAVDLGWQALAMEPLRPERYFLLATVSDETGGMPELGRQLRALGLEAMLAQGRASAENDRLQSPDLGKLEKCGTGL